MSSSCGFNYVTSPCWHAGPSITPPPPGYPSVALLRQMCCSRRLTDTQWGRAPCALGMWPSPFQVWNGDPFEPGSVIRLNREVGAIKFLVWNSRWNSPLCSQISDPGSRMTLQRRPRGLRRLLSAIERSESCGVILKHNHTRGSAVELRISTGLIGTIRWDISTTWIEVSWIEASRLASG